MSTRTPPIDPELLRILQESDEPPVPNEQLDPALIAELERRMDDPNEQVGIPWEELRPQLIARVQQNAARRRRGR
jgi:hypothetical protein